MTTGMFLLWAAATGAFSATSSSGARQIPDTFVLTNSSTRRICASRSSSFSGPCHLISTPNSFAAFSAPACTDFQNACVVPLGMTAMVVAPLPEGACCVEQPAQQMSAMRKIPETMCPGLSCISARLSCDEIRSELAAGGRKPSIGQVRAQDIPCELRPRSCRWRTPRARAHPRQCGSCAQ